MRYSVALSGLMNLTIWFAVGYARAYGTRLPTAVFYRRYRGLTSARFGGDAECGQRMAWQSPRGTRFRQATSVPAAQPQGGYQPWPLIPLR